MVKIIILFFSFFVPITICFFWFMTYQTNKEEKEQEPFYIKIITSSAISLILTLVFMFFVFVVFGSASFAKSIFNFDVDIKKLLFISVTIVGYAIINDHLIFTAVKYIFGKNNILIAILGVIRFAIFFLIGTFYSLTYNMSFILSIVFVILFALIDFVNLKEKKKE